MFGHPYERDFKCMVSNNMIQNWPINASNVTNDHTIFGTNLAGTRGKKVRQNPDRVVMDCVAVPKDILKWHKFINLVKYVMFVNGTPFLITMSHGIDFVTVEQVLTRMDKKLSKY